MGDPEILGAATVMIRLQVGCKDCPLKRMLVMVKHFTLDEAKEPDKVLTSYREAMEHERG